MKIPQAPAMIRVIAISHLVFGGFSLPCSLCVSWLAIFNPALSGGHGEQLQRAFLKQHIPGYESMFAGLALSSFALSTLLIPAGLGLLALKPWGRWTTVCFALGMLLTMSAFLVFALGYERPALLKFYVKQPDVVPGAWLTAIPALPGIVYATVVLVMMLLPKLSAAFANQRSLAGGANGGT